MRIRKREIAREFCNLNLQIQILHSGIDGGVVDRRAVKIQIGQIGTLKNYSQGDKIGDCKSKLANGNLRM